MLCGDCFFVTGPPDKSSSFCFLHLKPAILPRDLSKAYCLFSELPFSLNCHFHWIAGSSQHARGSQLICSTCKKFLINLSANQQEVVNESAKKQYCGCAIKFQYVNPRTCEFVLERRNFLVFLLSRVCNGDFVLKSAPIRRKNAKILLSGAVIIVCTWNGIRRGAIEKIGGAPTPLRRPLNKGCRSR
jgi:hypothetical protein